MLKLVLLFMMSVSLFGAHYPTPFSDLAHPLFKTRVQLDPLTEVPTLRRVTLDYVHHSDRVLGHFYRIKMSSSTQEKKAYYQALMKLEEEHADLIAYTKSYIQTVMEDDNYPLFLKMVRTKSPIFYSDAYLREKVYTYYHANRAVEASCYLDTRIKNEWTDLAYFYPTKRLNYASTENAYYREVFLITTDTSPYGQKIKAFFKHNNVKYKTLNYEKDAEAKQLFKKFKGQGIPLLIINNRTLVGYNEKEMDRLLRR